MAWLIFVFFLYLLVLFSERTLLHISPHDLEQLRTENKAGARLAYRLVLNLRATFSALLFARLWLKTLFIVFAVSALIQHPGVRRSLHELAQQSGLPGWLVWGLGTLGTTGAAALLFWSVKKTKWPGPFGRWARTALPWLSPFVYIWKILFTPFLPKKTTPLSPPGGEVATASSTKTAPDGAGEKHGDVELLKSIVKFSDVTVKQVMQPRSKVVAVDFRARFHELLDVVREAGFSRIPVFDEDLDNITGILYVKDLVPHLDKGADFEWQSLIRTTVQLVPEAKRVSELLQEFKRHKRHMAIVVDEYGGSSGIVTMEDVLEEITGEIRDEFDEESEIRYRKLDDHNYIFEGQTLLNDVCRIAGLDPGAFDDARGGADTLAGLVLELKGDIPKPGAEIDWKGYQLTVIAADERRIEQLKLTLLP